MLIRRRGAKVCLQISRCLRLHPEESRTDGRARREVSGVNSTRPCEAVTGRSAEESVPKLSKMRPSCVVHLQQAPPLVTPKESLTK